MHTEEPPPHPMFAEQTRTCPDCHHPFHGTLPVCDSCLAMRDAAAEAQAKEQRRRLKIAEWQRICPVEYRRTDWSRPDLSATCRHLAKEWWPNWSAEVSGLGIYGTSGLGKTRAMWDILRRLHFAGISVLAVDATAFAKAASDLFSDTAADKRDARDLLRRCKEVRVLLIDDIGKEPATPRSASALHEVLEIRTRDHLPLLWTSERTGEQLAAYLGNNYADGIVRRIRGTTRIENANDTQPTLL